MPDPTDRTDSPAEPAGSARVMTVPDDPELLDDAALTVAAPDVLAGSLGEYLRAWLIRIRSGGSGALPIMIGLVAIVIFFRIEQSSFLSSGTWSTCWSRPRSTSCSARRKSSRCCCPRSTSRSATPPASAHSRSRS